MCLNMALNRYYNGFVNDCDWWHNKIDWFWVIHGGVEGQFGDFFHLYLNMNGVGFLTFIQALQSI
jgi:hypothetical protein